METQANMLSIKVKFGLVILGEKWEANHKTDNTTDNKQGVWRGCR